MWANDEGIPLLGTPSHFNEFHTDPAYENLVLSLASGAIGNSDMPVIDVYGGPLGWIPVFNPAHVKGHGTDYVTLLTSCGGVGIPLNTNDLTNLDVESVEELADLSDLIIPGLPSPEMLMDPTYLWKTTDATDILERVDPETLLDVGDYTAFAGDHVDTWRLLWETALSDVSSGNPTGVLDVLKITDNINTLESLSGPLGGDIGSDLLSADAVSALLSEKGTSGLLGEEGVGGLLGGVTSGVPGGDGSGDDGTGGDGTSGGDGSGDDGTGGDGTSGTDGLGGLLGGDAAGGLLGGDAAGGLLGGDAIGGLLGGGTSSAPGGDSTSESLQYTAITSESDDAVGAAQCQGSLNGNVFSATCVYADMPAEVTSVTLNTGGDKIALESNGGTSGGAAGSAELTEEQIEALDNGEFTLEVTTADSDSTISAPVEPC
ncbi:hypothetical protein BH708_11525 [Brachybacterium sp. P6-10-X1]|nr:hypothetical protein BH708_11525 [Brachybacterium sp. P6-10-X1]